MLVLSYVRPWYNLCKKVFQAYRERESIGRTSRPSHLNWTLKWERVFSTSL